MCKSSRISHYGVRRRLIIAQCEATFGDVLDLVAQLILVHPGVKNACATYHLQWVPVVPSSTRCELDHMLSTFAKMVRDVLNFCAKLLFNDSLQCV